MVLSITLGNGISRGGGLYGRTAGFPKMRMREGKVGERRGREGDSHGGKQGNCK